MLHVFDCNVRVRFDDDDVIEWLMGEGEIDEEEAETYQPTYEDLKRYAWFLIECDDGEYDSPEESL